MKKQKSKQFIELCKKYRVHADLIPEILTYEEAGKVYAANKFPKQIAH